ncbi:MAG TPA: ABC transporter ATP-binding protein [Acidimicrobiia bacterium]|nr:ABC transporter ATP-binding protein [Acidimicrobiia bacterium]
MSWGLNGVSVDVDGEKALVDIDLACASGELVAVVGGDGAGKTTVSRTLVGLLEPRGGTVDRPPSAQIGYLPATSGVWPDLTVMENLSFVADIYRVPKSAARIDRLIERCDLGDARRRLGEQLSGGMRRKLGVAMALLPDPALLVLDEPSTGVDPVSRVELWSLMTAAAADGAAVVFTTTYLEEAERARSIVALESGRILATGSLFDIAASVPGVIVDVRADDGRAWRRGRQWRSWRPDGTVPAGSTRITGDLTDLLVAATLAAEDAS